MGGTYVYASELATMGTEIFTFDCGDGEQQDDPAEATEYPTDLGYTNADGVVLKAARHRFSGRVTETPLARLLMIPWDQPAGPGRANRAYDTLKKIRNACQPVAVNSRFVNCIGWITNLSKKSDPQIGGAIDITMEVVEVRRSVPAFASIPPSRLKPSVQAQAAPAASSGGVAAKVPKPDRDAALWLANQFGWRP